MTSGARLDRWLHWPSIGHRAPVRLFCVPYAGGRAAAYAPWPVALAPDVQVCAIELPGRGMRWGEAAITRMSVLLELLADAIEPHLDRPFAVFGHSLGALIAFELVATLERRGARAPSLLIVSGSPPPGIRATRRMLHDLADDELVAALRDLNGTPREVLENEELMSLMLPMLRADFALSETHQVRPDASVAVPMLALGGDRDPHAPCRGIEAWRRHTSGAFATYVLAGDHFFIHSAHDAMLAVVRRTLAEHAAVRVA